MNGTEFLSRKLSVRNAPPRNLTPDPSGSRRRNSPSKRKLTGRKALCRCDMKSLSSHAPKSQTQSMTLDFIELREDKRPISVKPGQVAEKTWILQNSGETQWPVMSHIIYTGGFIKPSNCEIVLPPLLPGKVALATAHFEAHELGEFEAHFRVSDPKKERRFMNGSCLTA